MKTTTSIAKQLRSENANLSWAAAMKQAHAILRAENAANGETFTSVAAANTALKAVCNESDFRQFQNRLGDRFILLTGKSKNSIKLIEFDSVGMTVHHKHRYSFKYNQAFKNLSIVEVEQA